MQTTSEESKDVVVVGFGNNAYGQLGVGTSIDHAIEPKIIRTFDTSGMDVISLKFALAARETAAIFSGLLHRCGDGYHSTFCPLDATESFQIEDVCVGDDFISACTSEGRILAWGNNDMGQLASGDRNPRSKPKFSDTFGGEAVIQLFAGKGHCVALSKSGNVLAWGANRSGQLGNGTLVSSITPGLVQELNHRPVVQIACGDSHTLARTVTGIVYAWGENTRGQLGLGDTSNRFRPECIRVLRAARPKDMSAGSGFTIVVGESGVVFGFGANQYGQIGLGADVKSVHTPTVIESLRGHAIAQVACGASHSLLLNESGSKVFVCGLNSSGQLGLGHTRNCYIPESVPTLEGQNVISVFSGPLAFHSIAISARPGVHPQVKPPLPTIDLDALKTSVAKLQQSIAFGHNIAGALKSLRSSISAAFSSISVLTASFRRTIRRYAVAVNDKESGVDLLAVREAYNTVLSLDNEQVLATLGRATLHISTQLVECPVDESESLSVFLVLLENPLLLEPSRFFPALEKLVSVLLGLPRAQRGLVYGWFRLLPSEFFARVVHVMQQYLSFALSNSHKVVDPAPAVLLLKTLFEANRETHIVPDWLFYNDEVPKYRDLLHDFQQFISSSSSVFTFCRYAFLLSAEVKSNLIRTTTARQMQASMQHYITSRGEMPSAPVPVDYPAGTRVMLTAPAETVESTPQAVGWAGLAVRVVFRIRRAHILSDTLTILLKIFAEDSQQLRLPIHVEFVGEVAQDVGGVAKEFFVLLIREFVTKLDILRETSDGRHLWFTFNFRDHISDVVAPEPHDRITRQRNPRTGEGFELHLLLGILVGLAAFNSIVVDFPVPPALYKRITGEHLSLNDLKTVDDELANGLQHLLNFEGDVKDTFSLNFMAARNPLLGFENQGNIANNHETAEDQEDGSPSKKVRGSLETSTSAEQPSVDTTNNAFVPLTNGGDDVYVTQSNRQEYVDLFVQHCLYKSVKPQVDEFIRGFMIVLGGPAVGLCTNTELDLLVGGLPDLGDFASLRECTSYSGEFNDAHAVIAWFWDVINSLSDSLKQKFLVFVTGSSRMPLGGARRLRLSIQSMGNNDQLLPNAHTCFNILDLPVYSSKEVLRERLLLALQHTQGFGIV